MALSTIARTTTLHLRGIPMAIEHLTRRAFSARLTSLLALSSAAPVVRAALARADEGASVPAPDGLSHSAEAIHQEVVLQASRSRVYDALTDAKQFSALMAFSTVPKAPPGQISTEPGGAFSLFGGYVLGRQVELVPGERIVQAWRAASWGAGWYSIARFELTGEGGATTVVLDHTGFPSGQGEHLAAGWHANYWEPLKKYLA